MVKHNESIQSINIVQVWSSQLDRHSPLVAILPEQNTPFYMSYVEWIHLRLLQVESASLISISIGGDQN